MKLTKKLYFLLSLIALLFCLSANVNIVNADDTDSSYSEETTGDFESSTQTYLDGKIDESTIETLVEQYVSALSSVASYTPEELEYVGKVMDYQTDLYSNFAEILGDESCGTYQSYDNLVVEEDKDDEENDNVIYASVDLHFENANITMTLQITCFDNIGAAVTSTEFSQVDEGEETLGEKMTDALSNTIMGLCVVFAILIFICLIISCFRFIPVIMDKFSGKDKKSDADSAIEEKKEDAKVESVQQDKTNSTVLVAVIAAAIAAYEGTATDDFVVRSIRRR